MTLLKLTIFFLTKIPCFLLFIATPKALRTSASPGLTRALSTRLKLSQNPLVYSFDSPGVMLPFLGKGTLGAERGIKLALIGRFFAVRCRTIIVNQVFEQRGSGRVSMQMRH